MEKITYSAIKTFLETAPTYTTNKFTPDSDVTDIDVSQIDVFCHYCKSTRPFNTTKSKGSRPTDTSPFLLPGQKAPKLNSRLELQKFECVTCQQSYYNFMIRISVSDKTITLEKVGQDPRTALQKDKYLEKFSEHDIDLYRKAMACEANGYGIGAFAYYRRILEKNISSLLDLIKEEANATGQSSEIMQAIEDLRKESPMCDKIEIANKALPPHLLVNGINPLGRLYKILSEGVHSKPDEGCLQIAHQLREALKYLLSELASRKARRETYASQLGTL